MGERSRILFEKAVRYIPGGVNSPVRAGKAVGVDPKNGAAHNALAINYYILKQYSLARQHAKISQNLGFTEFRQLKI